MWINGHFRRTFGFGWKQSYHIRCTFGFGGLQLVNSVVAESRSQSLSCGECARRRESLASLCTDYTEEASALSASASGTVRRTADMMGLMWKISDARDSWATNTGWDLLASIVVSAQIRLTFGFSFGFRPKVPLHFRWHIRFRYVTLIRHFWPTFGYGRKWNFHRRSTSIHLHIPLHAL